MKELGEAINESLSDSDQIGDVIGKIKTEGYDVFLVLEATVGFNKRNEQEEQPTPVMANSEPEFKLNAQDLRFLKSLRISLEDSTPKRRVA